MKTSLEPKTTIRARSGARSLLSEDEPTEPGPVDDPPPPPLTPINRGIKGPAIPGPAKDRRAPVRRP